MFLMFLTFVLRRLKLETIFQSNFEPGKRINQVVGQLKSLTKSSKISVARFTSQKIKSKRGYDGRNTDVIWCTFPRY